MSDIADLQAQIVALAGAINRHKTGTQAPQHTARPPHQYDRRYNNRWTPYAPVPVAKFKHKTLVNMPAPPPDINTNPSTTTKPADAALVKTQGINNQLMTPSTYVREQQFRQIIPAFRAIKPPQFDLPPKRASTRIIELDGLEFEMKEDGSKLTRIYDTQYPRETPRQAVIAGVEFLRTKNGNLLRRVVLKDTMRKSEPARPQCEKFTKNGTCPFGPKCHFAHDPEKVAMCKSFLRNGSCSNGEYCDLSHKPTYNRVPACLHFQKDACNNEGCRYPHVHTSPGAAVCRSFATLGYCDKGTDCDNRHVFECPDFANTGTCPNLAECALTHVVRAHIERAAAGSESEIEDNSSGVVDSEGQFEAFTTGHLPDAQLADNEDYVALS